MSYDIIPPSERAVCEHVRPVSSHAGVLFLFSKKLVSANLEEGFSFVIIVPPFFSAFC
jgi:hypothetical protein